MGFGGCCPFQDQKQGFSLIEVLIVLGIMSIMALAFAQLILNNQRAEKNVASNAEFTSLVSSLNSLINNETSCTAAFAPYSLVATASSNVNPLVLNGSDIARVTPTPKSGLNVTSLQLQPLGTPTPLTNPPGLPAGSYNQFSAQLNIQATRKLPDSTGSLQNVGAPMQRSIVMNVITDSTNQIQRCSAEASSVVPEQQICEMMGGTYSTATTPRCKTFPRNCYQKQNGGIGKRVYCDATTHIVTGGGAKCGGGGEFLTESNPFWDLTGKGWEANCWRLLSTTIHSTPTTLAPMTLGIDLANVPGIWVICCEN